MDKHRRCVSIHAPVMGATCGRQKQTAGICCFNPRTRDGCDRRPAGRIYNREEVSIHAPVMGATPRRRRVRSGPRRFNPRTRDGCDLERVLLLFEIIVSIHAPVMGATKNAPIIVKIEPVSIHAPVMGATPRVRDSRLSPDSFNPRTRDGCDPSTIVGKISETGFQSTHP